MRLLKNIFLATSNKKKKSISQCTASFNSCCFTVSNFSQCLYTVVVTVILSDKLHVDSSR